MRPLKITMSAFGPYAEKVEIDIDKLGANGLYLITGDTGAGKTTIFDAIAFALYGEASGNNRAAAVLRSKYASPETPTEVELYFEYAQKTYYIKRSLKESFMSCREDSDFIVKGKKDAVTKAVENLIGIDKNQFSQIVMLAQGDFMKILLAKAKDRSIIFRKLFHTEYYERFQEKLKEHTKKIGDLSKVSQERIKQYISEIQLCDDKMLSDNMPVDDVLEILSEAVIKDCNELTTIKNQLDNISKELDSVNNEFMKCNDDIKLSKELQKYEKLSAEKAPLIEKSKSEYDAAAAKTTEIEYAESEIAVIKSQLESYDELERRKSELNKTQNDLNNLITRYNENAANKDTIEKKLAACKDELSGLENAGEAREKYIHELSDIKKAAALLNELADNYDEYTKQKKQLETAQAKYLKMAENAQSLHRVYEKRNKDFLDNQAGILAMTLTDGKKCPVCGSTEHPQPAVCPDEAPTEAELKTAKSDMEKADSEAQKASEYSGKINTKVYALNESIKEKSEKIFGIYNELEIENDIKTKSTEYSEKTACLESAINTEEKRIERRNKLTENISGYELDLKDINDKHNSFGNEISSLNSKKDEISRNIDSLKSGLKFEDKHKAMEHIKMLADKNDKLKSDINKTREIYQNNKERQLELNGKIKTISEQIIGYTEENLVELKSREEDLRKNKSMADEIQQNLHTRVSFNKSIQKKLTDEHENSKKLLERKQWIENLSKTANGELSNTEKISLETYVQTSFFEKIIGRANKRFSVMTKGQYELKRRTEVSDKRIKSGLELNIIDHYNGTEREVSTLSGGESFMASLSLALGLSEEIQCSSGGIQLDTMFIDEGFGSLDEETLNQAMKAISDLAEGKRLVGIISHVSELKNRIDKQIIVRKEKTGGSSIEIVD